MGPRRRRLVAIFGALIALVAGAALYAFQARRTVPLAAPHARVAARVPTTPLSVCWIETAKILDDTASGLLVRHPRGDVLIDGGNSTRFFEEIADYPFGDRLWLSALPGALRVKTPLPEALRAAGADPARLRWFLPTHAHLDHVGGIVDLPEATQVLFAQPELDWVNATTVPRGVEVVPAHAARLRGHMAPIQFRPVPYERFDESADLFDDGSVVIVPLYGHTPGSVGVFVNVSATRRIFHVGDAAHDWRGLEKALADPPILARTNSDPARADDVLAALSVFHREAPEIAIVPAHARPAWKRVFGDQPGGCISR